MTVKEFEKYLYGLKGKLRWDEGLLFGNHHQKIKGIQVCWMATLNAIKNAYKKGANLILAHETLFYPLPFRHLNRPKDFRSWFVNKQRIELLSKYGIAVLRFHTTLDEICIFDDFAKALHLPEPSVAEEGFVKLYDIKPITVEEMIRNIKKYLSLDSVRVTHCNLKKKVSRVGLLWGGLGLFINVDYAEKLLKHKPDIFIAGEADSQGMLFAIDAGVVMIETSHEISENIGLKNFAKKLKKDIKDIPIIFYENKIPWINR